MLIRTIRNYAFAAISAAALSVSVASAADGWIREGGNPGIDAQRAIGSAVCTAVTLSVLKSDNVGASTSSVAFTTLPNATAAVQTNGPRCLKVVFTAETICRLSAAADFCYLRALVNGAAMNPNDATRAIDSESSTARGHAYEWFLPVTAAGTYTVAIQGRVGNSATRFTVDDWTLDLEVTTR